ncbi:hypothetical protein GQ457_09G018810 [Hibiscus cannabinus]
MTEEFKWKLLVWNVLAPLKVEAFIWQVMYPKVLVGMELIKSGVSLNLSVLCHFCIELPESMEHLFFSCKAWSPSPSRRLKFNIDGSMKADGSTGGIGGVLKDEYKHTLMTLSLKIGSGPSIMAEILALQFGLQPFLSSAWVDRFKLVIECDCRVAIEWVRSPSLALDCFKVWVTYLHKALVEGGFCFRHILRQCNIETDSLGKNGAVGGNLASFVL